MLSIFEIKSQLNLLTWSVIVKKTQMFHDVDLFPAQTSIRGAHCEIHKNKEQTNPLGDLSGQIKATRFGKQSHTRVFVLVVFSVVVVFIVVVVDRPSPPPT